MRNISRLCDTIVGEKVVVDTILTKGKTRRRFYDIGIISGTEIECVGKSPLGDPTAYLIRGAVIALRKQDSENILVRKAGKTDGLKQRNSCKKCT